MLSLLYRFKNVESYWSKIVNILSLVYESADGRRLHSQRYMRSIMR